MQAEWIMEIYATIIISLSSFLSPIFFYFSSVWPFLIRVVITFYMAQREDERVF